MKKNYFIFGIMLALGMLFVGLYSFNKLSFTNNQNNAEASLSPASNSNSPTINTQVSPSASSVTPPASEDSSALSFQDNFEQIAQSIGQTTNNPQAADQAITNLAMKINSTQLKELYSQITSKDSSGDEKLLATELLIRSPLAESLDYLKQIVNSPATESAANSPLAQQEFRSMQMLAVEGLGQKPQFKIEAKVALNELSQTTDDPLLLDRIQRTRLAIDGKVPAPELQDQKALEQVLHRETAN